MKTIPLTKGKVALVDDVDYTVLNRHKWQAHWNDSGWYARRVERVGSTRRQISMHRQILGVTDPLVEIDHRDNDGLNNQRYNIRTCTHAQNMANVPKRRGNSSGHRGVMYYPRRNRWVAFIKVAGKPKNLGTFTSAKDAATAYENAAREHFGEFAFAQGIPQ